MAQLRQDYQEFVDRDTEILVVGPEGPLEFEEYWKEKDLPFFGLPDPDHKVLKLYRQEISLLKLGRMPAQMIIDKSGQIRNIHYGKSMQDIPDNKTVLEFLDEINRRQRAEFDSQEN